MEIDDGEEDTYLLFDGFEEAIVGYGTQFNTNLVIYDYKQCLQILVTRDGMTWEEAKEYFSFNVAGAWVGEKTPVIMYGTGSPMELFHMEHNPSEDL
jgi:hypothetical protein